MKKTAPSRARLPKVSPAPRTAKTGIEWTKGDRPPEHGYYLATWLGGGQKLVSELWFNPTTGWFASRGYLSQERGDKIGAVIAWAPKPQPY